MTIPAGIVLAFGDNASSIARASLTNAAFAGGPTNATLPPAMAASFAAACRDTVFTPSPGFARAYWRRKIKSMLAKVFFLSNIENLEAAKEQAAGYA